MAVSGFLVVFLVGLWLVWLAGGLGPRNSSVHGPCLAVSSGWLLVVSWLGAGCSPAWRTGSCLVLFRLFVHLSGLAGLLVVSWLVSGSLAWLGNDFGPLVVSWLSSG